MKKKSHRKWWKRDRKYHQSNAQPAVGSVEEDERNDVGVNSLQGTAPKLTLRPVNHHCNAYQHKLTPHPVNHHINAYQHKLIPTLSTVVAMLINTNSHPTSQPS